MKTKVLFIFLFFALGSFVVNAQDDLASILFSNPNLAYKISLSSNGGDSETRMVTEPLDGLTYLETVKYAYFKVDDFAIPPTENKLILKITYYDLGTNNLTFQYNAIPAGEVPTSSDNYVGLNIKKTGSNKWVTSTIVLANASFRNAQNTGADFRIAGGNYIREIKFSKGELNPENEPIVPVTASDYSEFIGKSVAGYQVWFSTGNATSGWVHWNGGSAPAKEKLSFEVYPDVSDYDDADLAQTGFANLGNGEPAKLFNSTNTGVIETHFDWMRDSGIDGVAVQRFIGGIAGVLTDSPDAYPLKIKRAAERTQRIFYICYDISSNLETTWTDIIKFDWVYNVEKIHELTKSPAYAKVGNRPVVQIWGAGFTSRPGTAAQTIELINFLKERGCYVIGGVPTSWRTERDDSKPNFMSAYNEFDMLSPWMVGRMANNSGSDSRLNNFMKPDKAHCDQLGIDYMPVLFPGFAWSQWNSGAPNQAPRNSGDFMWHQATNIKTLGVKNMYFAMFDEYDEGTAIMKNATDWSTIPTDQYFLTSSADGYWLSSDFQLRVAGAAIEMLKGQRELTANVPVAHSEGPVYYRNSFESRRTKYDYYAPSGSTTKISHGEGVFKLDPCFYGNSQISIKDATGQSTVIEETIQAMSGLYAARIKGTANASNAHYYYKFSSTQIDVRANMELSFAKYAINDLGRYTTVSLAFSDGTYLHNLSLTDKDGLGVNPKNPRGTIGAWTKHACMIGTSNLIGKTITGILLGYESEASGIFDAYFDNILIEDKRSSSSIFEISLNTIDDVLIYLENRQINITAKAGLLIRKIDIYDVSGRLIFSENNLNTTNYILSLPSAISKDQLAIVKVHTSGGLKVQKVKL